MKRFVLSCILVIFSISSVLAQDNKDSFQKYREKMLSGFQGFRQSILDDYAKFLNGIWEDYTAFKGEQPYALPKPKVQPRKKEKEPNPKPKEVIPQEIEPSNPIPKDKPNNPKPVVVNPSNVVSFDWCGISMRLPDAKIQGYLRGLDKENILAFFNEIHNSQVRKDVLPQIINIANEAKFNDWCVYLLIRDYVRKIKYNADSNTRNFICWYMMTAMGFDIRLAFIGNGVFYLIPFKHKAYGTFVLIRDIPYFVYGEGEIDDNAKISTPPVPDEDLGDFVNMILTRPLQIPYKAKKFSHTFAGRTLSGEVNENLVKVMANFPIMPIPLYAISEGDSKARKQVLDQMRSFISGMSEFDAANFILQFIQSYDYATDDEQFGYEKPFFVEETLYYPKCDCEDRAIFYHFLVTNLLGNDVHLVHYPLHECTAVNFSQNLNADCYIYQGKQYVICDPTYIGATIGMCMPDFRNTRPEIELTK